MKTLKSYPSYKDSENPFLKMIPSTWKKSKLKKHFKITSSKRVFENDWKSEGIPFYRARDISHLNNPNYLPDIFISREHYLRNISIHGPINIGDIIVTAVGTLGEVLVIREDKKFYFKDGNIIWFKTLNNIESDYVRLLFKTPIIKEQIKYNSNTTTVGTLTIENAKNFEIPLPSIQEQQKIIDFLNQKTSEIDTLIEDKEKLIALLEEKRQAIITEAVTKGLDPDVKMKESGVEWIGEIPEHWESNKFKRIANYIKDGTHGSFARVDNGYPLLSAKNVMNGEIIIGESESQISLGDFSEITKSGYLKEGCLLLTIVGTLGRAAIYSGEKVAFQRSVAIIGINDKNYNRFIYYVTQGAYFKRELELRTKKSAQSGVYLSDLALIPVLLPPLSEQIEISKQLDDKIFNIDKLIREIKTQIQLIKKYRQSLIYEAVTGKIDVQEMVKETEQEEVSSS